MIRVYQCEDVETQVDNMLSQERNSSVLFPVFAVVCTKSKQMENTNPLLEFNACEKKIEKISSVENLNTRIRSVQYFGLLCHQLRHEDRAAQDLCIELMDTESPQKSPKYTLFVVDGKCDAQSKFAALIVPQGRYILIFLYCVYTFIQVFVLISETDWLCRTYEGRCKLAELANLQRLVVIHLGAEHEFVNMEHVQIELSQVLLKLQPLEALSPNNQVSVNISKFLYGMLNLMFLYFNL